MENSLSHLPEDKQRQILDIVEIIKEVAPAKIILYGSYARGTWQQGRYVKGNTGFEFNSDYDFLVAMKDNDLKTIELSEKIAVKCRAKAPINALVFSIDHINEGLSKGQYFFIEMIENGISLYDTHETEFAKPRELTSQERKEIAQEYFDFWFELSSDFYDTAIRAYDKSLKQGRRLNFSLYNLFQATECLYSTVLLVFTGYKPKTHNLNTFRKLIMKISDELYQIFPLKPKDRYDAELFDLLNRAYISAKYKIDFEIDAKELSDLIKQVKKMKNVVKKICLGKIKSFSPKS